MGSSISKIHEELAAQRATEKWIEDKEWIDNVAVGISNIDPDSQEFSNFKWLWENKEKIIKQRQLIDIIK